MGRTLGVVEAANTIREHVKLQHMDPHTQHELGFIKAVATALGLDHSPETVTHIAGLLREHDIDIHPGNEYPKWVGDRIVQSPEEEAALAVSAPEPTPEPTPEPAAEPVTRKPKRGEE